MREFPQLNVVDPLVIDERAMNVYIGRFLTSVTPPEELIGKKYCIFLCLQLPVNVYQIVHYHNKIIYLFRSK